MIGVVVVTHGKLAEELISVVKFVMAGEPAIKMENVSIDPNKEFEKFAQEIKKAIRNVDDGDGVLVVTDMFGGTPSNVSLTFLEENKLEVISGVNLPMLLKLATLSANVTLDEAVKIAESAGRDNIIVASKLLQKRNQ
ncbi:MAG TPA: PTS fructose transporter subunit IIA [Thermodesulfobacteriota bacterium]|nr:PTS fructose transporter subunit IIA [Thermodesulfobacteriota bacterium]